MIYTFVLSSRWPPALTCRKVSKSCQVTRCGPLQRVLWKHRIYFSFIFFFLFFLFQTPEDSKRRLTFYIHTYKFIYQIPLALFPAVLLKFSESHHNIEGIGELFKSFPQLTLLEASFIWWNTFIAWYKSLCASNEKKMKEIWPSFKPVFKFQFTYFLIRTFLFVTA